MLSLAVATPAAYALAKFKLRGSNVIRFALLITQMIPGIVIANSLYPTYNDIGLLNSRLGLILADASSAIPFAILIIYAFMVTLPMEIVEAARVDGAGQIRAFVKIVVPVSRNAVITAALAFSFLFSWSDFLFALTLNDRNQRAAGDARHFHAYLSNNVVSWGPVMATGVLSALPAIVVPPDSTQRFIAAGAAGQGRHQVANSDARWPCVSREHCEPGLSATPSCGRTLTGAARRRAMPTYTQDSDAA